MIYSWAALCLPLQATSCNSLSVCSLLPWIKPWSSGLLRQNLESGWSRSVLTGRVGERRQLRRHTHTHMQNQLTALSQDRGFAPSPTQPHVQFVSLLFSTGPFSNPWHTLRPQLSSQNPLSCRRRPLVTFCSPWHWGVRNRCDRQWWRGAWTGTPQSLDKPLLPIFSVLFFTLPHQTFSFTAHSEVNKTWALEGVRQKLVAFFRLLSALFFIFYFCLFVCRNNNRDKSSSTDSSQRIRDKS